MFIRLGRHVINLNTVARVDLNDASIVPDKGSCVSVYLLVPSGADGRYGADYQEFFGEDAAALRRFFGAEPGPDGYRAEVVTLRE